MAPDPDPGRPLVAAPARYQVRLLSPGELTTRRDEWADLLARSDADPLFCSPEWLLEWWALHGESAGLEPVFAAVERDGRLVGLALFALARVRYRGLLPIRRLEMLGNGRHRRDFTMSEHMGFIVDAGEGPGVGTTLLASLLALPSWDELVIGHSDRGASTERLLAEAAKLAGGYLRRTDPMEAWRIELERGLEGWRRSLGAATRERIFGGRRRLERLGRVTETVADPGSLERCLEILDGLHAGRWGSPLFTGARGRLYRSIAGSQVARGHPVVSVLEFDGRPLSAMLNFRAGDREYSIQAGFGPAPGKRISPGWVHLGHRIEQACSDGVRVFDLLGGEGKNSQYKASLGATRSELVTLQLIRSRGLRALYRARDAIRAR